ncbi:hypothetical protein Tco_1511015 [Tanacetum coccineum]
MDVDSSLMGRLIEIGLLCTQYRPNHRPTMEEVVDMLHTGTSHTIPKGSGMMYTIFKDAMWFLSDKDYEVSAEWNKENDKSLMCILKCFEEVSVLRVNYNKSKLYGIGVNDGELSDMALRMGCGVGEFPFTYLG